MAVRGQDIASVIRRQIEEFGQKLTMVDVGVVVDGYLADTAQTVHLGDDPRLKRLIDASASALAAAIEVAGPGVPIKDLSTVIEETIQAMAKHAYPLLPGIGSFVGTRYDTLSKVGGIGAPVFVLHGDRDDIAPFDMGVAVFEAASSPKRFYRIEGAGHNDTYLVGGQPYWDALKRFMESLAI